MTTPPFSINDIVPVPSAKMHPCRAPRAAQHEVQPPATVVRHAVMESGEHRASASRRAFPPCSPSRTCRQLSRCTLLSAVLLELMLSTSLCSAATDHTAASSAASAAAADYGVPDSILQTIANRYNMSRNGTAGAAWFESPFEAMPNGDRVLLVSMHAPSHSAPPAAACLPSLLRAMDRVRCSS